MPTPDVRPQTGAVVLAAGAGSRMGHLPKPLIQRNGEPLLLRQIRLLAEAGVTQVVVVLGYYAMRVSEVLEKTRWSVPDSPIARVALKWTINPQPGDGTASSLRCGLRRLPVGLTEILVVLGDQPLLEADDVTALLSAWDQRDSAVQLLLPEHAGVPGHPLVFTTAVRDAVLGGGSVPQWRKAHASAVLRLPVSNPRYTTDLDTPEDLARLQRVHGLALELPA